MKEPKKVDYKDWAEEFLAAQVEPLDKEHANWFALGVTAELVGLPAPMEEEVFNDLLMQVLQSRGKEIGLRITPYALVTITGLDSVDRVGCSVMYTYALRYWQLTHEDREITMEVLGEEIFPLGFPTLEELKRLWTMQKEGGTNMLDRIIPDEEVHK